QAAIDTGRSVTVEGPSTTNWTVILDDGDRPQGWLHPDAASGDRPVETDDIRLGGTLIHPDGNLRSALDAALSSPSSQGVAVDDAGRLIGVVAADAVLAAINATRPHAPPVSMSESPSS